VTAPVADTRPASLQVQGDQPWVNVARLLATAAVVAIHVISPFMQSGSDNKVGPLLGVGVAVMSLCRWSVPLFVVVSGYLALRPGRREPVGTYYSKRLHRIIVPLVVWTIFYVTFNGIVTSAAVPPFNSYLQGFVRGQPYYHLYFLFIMAGLACVTPLLRVFTDAANTRMLTLATGIALALACVAKMLQVGYNESGYSAFNLFVPYLGYYLFGALLARAIRPLISSWILVGVLGAAVAGTFATTWVLHLRDDSSIWWTIALDYLSPFTIVATMAVALILLQALGPGRSEHHSSRARPWLRRAAELTFGIYLIHPVLLLAWRANIPAPRAAKLYTLDLAPIVGWQAVTWLGVLLISALVVLVFRSIPVLRRIF
jgi:surface polysaccharide O-acyltransferase-like enzyme